jgi:hypothetical protein
MTLQGNRIVVLSGCFGIGLAVAQRRRARVWSSLRASGCGQARAYHLDAAGIEHSPR